MSDEDESSKTEEPTAKRLQDARARGQIVHSQELQIWATLTGAALALAFLVPAAAKRIVEVCRPFLERPESMQVGRTDAPGGLAKLLLDIGLVAGPTLLLLAFCGIGCALAQSGLLWAPSRLAPDWSKLSPLKGVQRLASGRAVVEFIKNLAKLSLVAAALIMLLAPLLPGAEQWAAMSPAGILERSDHVLVRMLAAVAVLMAFIAGADYLYQRLAFLKQMRMSTQELRDEFKQSDGDPHIKARIRRLRQERAKKRMMAAVPTATVVITNPTHYAVALAYDAVTMPAPKVVAKGMDSLALRIRALATEHAVPVVENPPLARSLHASVNIDDEIPPEHYQAVAQVIGWVMRTHGGGAGR